MSYSNTTNRLRRDSNLENKVALDIVSLFTEKWEDTSRRSPREVMEMVLTKMRDSCLSYTCDDEPTEESAQLEHANVFFTITIDELKSPNPLPYAVSGVDLQATLDNLSAIKRYADGKEFSKDIIARINVFQTLIRQYALEFGNKQKTIFWKSFLAALIAAGIAAAYALSDWRGNAFEFVIVLFLPATAVFAGVYKFLQGR